MKNIKLLFTLLIIQLISFGQKGSLVVTANETCQINIDGDAMGILQKDDLRKFELELGQHIMVLKSAKDVQKKIFELTDSKQEIITVEFKPSKKSTNDLEVKKQSEEIVVTNMDINLPGFLTQNGANIRKYYAFDKGDEIKVSFQILNNKGTGGVSIHPYPSGGVIFSEGKSSQFESKDIIIPSKGIYYFDFHSNHGLDRKCNIKITRKPGPESSVNFSTNARKKVSLNPIEVLTTNLRVYSIENLNHVNRTIVPINLPKNTVKWTYWIGVGQESVEQLDNFAKTLSSSVKAVTNNPIIAIGAGLIPSLPIFKSSANINYLFTDKENAALFKNYGNKIPYKAYDIKQGDNISSSYSTVNGMYPDLVLCLLNMNSFYGRDVNVKVVAFTEETTYIMGEDENK